MSEKEAFQGLYDVMNRLLGPGGCPWDQEQTLKTLRPYILEESCEVIDAINQGNDQALKEELGDLFFNILFFSKVAENDGRFTIVQVIEGIKNKLIERHPHVYGDETFISHEIRQKQWDAIKAKSTQRKTLFEGIPHGLPSLARAQKILGLLKKANQSPTLIEPKEIVDEDTLGQALLSLVQKGASLKLDAEQALRKTLSLIEKDQPEIQ